MSVGIYQITEEFEKELGKYTGAPYVICVDNASNGLFLCLKYVGVKNIEVEIPSHTYPSVPCEIIHAGGKVKFKKSSKFLKGEYQLYPTNIWDSALKFTHNMFRPNSFQVLSFTGPYKHFKLGKGGAILTDSKKAMEWFKRMRFSGRREKPYLEDNLDMVGYNFYLSPEISMRGLLLIKQFYNLDGNPKINKDIKHIYPDLSKFPVYTKGN